MITLFGADFSQRKRGMKQAGILCTHKEPSKKTFAVAMCNNYCSRPFGQTRTSEVLSA